MHLGTNIPQKIRGKKMAEMVKLPSSHFPERYFSVESCWRLPSRRHQTASRASLVRLHGADSNIWTRTINPSEALLSAALVSYDFASVVTLSVGGSINQFGPVGPNRWL